MTTTDTHPHHCHEPLLVGWLGEPPRMRGTATVPNQDDDPAEGEGRGPTKRQEGGRGAGKQREEGKQQKGGGDDEGGAPPPPPQ